MGRSDRDILRLGVERGYIEPAVAEAIQREATARGRPAESLLLQRKILSPRRIQRLRVHVRYRSVRKTDKRYGALAVQEKLITRGQVRASLDHQRQIFEQKREVVRLGSHLIERGLLTVEDDRRLRRELSGASLPSDVVRSVAGETPSSGATLALHEQSMGPRVSASSYAQIEEAVRRVDTLRAITKDLSCSDNVGVGEDSANEIENALAVLARRRLGSEDVEESKPRPSGRRKKRSTRKKTTGLMRIFRQGAA